MAQLAVVRSLLKDAALEGAVMIKKRKLLWLLGWGQDREGAWEELLVQWTEIGEDRATLRGLDVAGHIVLTGPSTAQYEPVRAWAGERVRA